MCVVALALFGNRTATQECVACVAVYPDKGGLRCLWQIYTCPLVACKLWLGCHVYICHSLHTTKGNRRGEWLPPHYVEASASCHQKTNQTAATRMKRMPESQMTFLVPGKRTQLQFTELSPQPPAHLYHQSAELNRVDRTASS